MTSPDDPDRNPISPRRSGSDSQIVRCRVTTRWSPAARREYSALGYHSSAVALNGVAKRAVRACLNHLHQHNAWNQSAQALALDLSFVSDKEIQDYNAHYRGKNKPTDVLSFAQTEGESWSHIAAGEELLLGDVVLAIGTAHRQSLELKHSFEHELSFLTVHGTLHLCGFDHDTSSRRRTMWKLQDTIVAALNLPSDFPSCSSL